MGGLAENILNRLIAHKKKQNYAGMRCVERSQNAMHRAKSECDASSEVEI
jgi:hypothetical protein